MSIKKAVLFIPVVFFLVEAMKLAIRGTLSLRAYGDAVLWEVPTMLAVIVLLYLLKPDPRDLPDEEEKK